VLFDAIEFNDRFACIDVLYDLAFLLMDLDQHGLRGHANTVFNRYLELSGEHTGLSAMPLFLSCRAAVRAHTTVAKAETSDDDALRTCLLQDAAALLDRAVDYLGDPTPRLIAIGGVSGTGKSTLAYALAPLLGVAPGAVVVRSDVVRKHLMGVAESARLPASAYTQAVSERVYSRIFEVASDTLASGYSLIADAVFGTVEERQEIEKAAQRRGVAFKGLWLEGPPALLEQRIAARHGDASDATPDVLHAQLSFVSVPQSWSPINAAASVGDMLAQARRILSC
jgi:predicted kinase